MREYLGAITDICDSSFRFIIEIVKEFIMTVSSLIREIAFEKDCSIRKATQIYKQYKSEGKLDELLYKIKYHKEV